MPEEFKSLFTDYVVPMPSMGGDWGGTKNGDTGFQGAQKGTAGKIPEVTFVDVKGGDKPGASAGVGKEIANRKGATD
jgi:hypothetical protein